ncbi:hypothetical protein ACIQCG_34030 [Streptomyces noursei]|uniref:hypothetical protein n=1 Tax=Streptomyces noursei TaxID=1971 RepID=UPI00382A37D4
MRDQHHRLPVHWRGRGAFVGELFAHPLKDPFGDGELVPFGPYLRQLLGQLFFEFVQFRAPRGDPCQQLGTQHAQDRRRPPGHIEREPASRPLSPDQAHHPRRQTPHRPPGQETSN